MWLSKIYWQIVLLRMECFAFCLWPYHYVICLATKYRIVEPNRWNVSLTRLNGNCLILDRGFNNLALNANGPSTSRFIHVLTSEPTSDIWDQIFFSKLLVKRCTYWVLVICLTSFVNCRVSHFSQGWWVFHKHHTKGCICWSSYF